MDKDDRHLLDVSCLQSLGLFEQALRSAGSISVAHTRHDRKHGLYAAMDRYPDACHELASLMNDKDSVYIKVQNEDIAILDAEMNNAAPSARRPSASRPRTRPRCCRDS